MATKKTTTTEPEAPKWKPYREMTLKEMQELGVPQDVQEDYFPEEFKQEI